MARDHDDPDRRRSTASWQLAQLAGRAPGRATVSLSGWSAGRPDQMLRLQRSAGNDAVRNLVARQQTGAAPLSLQTQKAPPNKPAGAQGITVHPASGLSAARLIALLRKHPDVPDVVKKSLTARGDAIMISGKDPQKAAGTFSLYLEPLIAALRSPDWQITTAKSTITVAGTAANRTWTQIVTPDLSKNQRLGSTVKTGPGETSFLANPLASTNKEVIYGWTAHAGRMTKGLPEAHGERDVDDIAEEVGGFFRYSAATRGPAPSATTTDIYQFIEPTATP